MIPHNICMVKEKSCLCVKRCRHVCHYSGWEGAFLWTFCQASVNSRCEFNDVWCTLLLNLKGFVSWRAACCVFGSFARFAAHFWEKQSWTDDLFCSYINNKMLKGQIVMIEGTLEEFAGHGNLPRLATILKPPGWSCHRPSSELLGCLVEPGVGTIGSGFFWSTEIVSLFPSVVPMCHMNVDLDVGLVCEEFGGPMLNYTCVREWVLPWRACNNV